jgi:hypothetical protein
MAQRVRAAKAQDRRSEFSRSEIRASEGPAATETKVTDLSAAGATGTRSGATVVASELATDATNRDTGVVVPADDSHDTVPSARTGGDAGRRPRDRPSLAVVARLPAWG